MAIRAYLEGQTFDGETIRLMGIAFEMALGSFGATPGCDDPVRAARGTGFMEYRIGIAVTAA
jgi:hypothetical protein